MQVRMLLILVVFFSNGLAWCFFYGTQWAIAFTGVTYRQALLHVYLALFLSFVSFLIIRGLDKIEDSGVLGKQSAKAIEEIIDALGILIGFSWEQSFDQAVDSISETLKADLKMPTPISRLLMSAALVAIVFPAWKNYILPQELKLEEENTTEGKKHKRFEELINKHKGLFLEKESDEREIDHAHLAMKMHRRQMHSKKHHLKVAPGLTHMLVTAKGITEIPTAGHKAKMLTERLLPECMQEPAEEEPEPGRFTRALSSLRVFSGKSNVEKENKEPESLPEPRKPPPGHNAS